MREETTPFGRLPWMTGMQNFTAPGIPFTATAMIGMQKAWIESAATAMRGLQWITPLAQPGWKNAPNDVGLQVTQEAMKTTQQVGTAILDANMKAFEAFGRFAEAWGAMAGRALEQTSEKIPAASTPAKALETATKTAFGNFEQAQEANSKAWAAMQKRLSDGIKEWNETASAWTQGTNLPSAIKESYQRLASDGSGLFEVIQKTNTSALSLMQKRFSAAVNEMARQYPGQGTEKLEAASRTYEKAASTISDTLLQANKEAMEALQAWSTESEKAGKPGQGQRAA